MNHSNQKLKPVNYGVTIKTALETAAKFNDLSQSVTLCGWVKTHRRSKNVSFIQLADGVSSDVLQLVIAPTLTPYQKIADQITTGSSLKCIGNLVASPGSEQDFELHVTDLELFGTADAESYPLQKKGHTLEFLRQIPGLRLRSNTLSATMRVRSRAAGAIHAFFREQNFHYVNSPIITSSDCEGAGEMFRVTTLDPLKQQIQPSSSESSLDPYSKDFFAAPSFLSVSGQLEAEVAALALRNVYTFAPTFRAENSQTTRHLAEFWMIEPEMAFAGLGEDLELAQNLLQYVIKDVLNSCQRDLEFLHTREWSHPGSLEQLAQLCDKEFAIIDYTDAVQILTSSGKSFEFPVAWGIDLQTEHERFLTDEYCKGPVAVINYPKEIKAFYMLQNSDGKTVSAMDLLVPRLGEIIGGSAREHRLEPLLERIKEVGVSEEALSWYIDLRRFGTVPHAGSGLGFERLVMYLTDIQNIRDVTMFPRYPGHI